MNDPLDDKNGSPSNPNIEILSDDDPVGVAVSTKMPDPALEIVSESDVPPDQPDDDDSRIQLNLTGSHPNSTPPGGNPNLQLSGSNPPPGGIQPPDPEENTDSEGGNKLEAMLQQQHLNNTQLQALRLWKISKQIKAQQQAIDEDLLNAIREDIEKYRKDFSDSGSKTTVTPQQLQKGSYSEESLQQYTEAGKAFHPNISSTKIDPQNQSFDIQDNQDPSNPVQVKFTRENVTKDDDPQQQATSKLINRITISGNHSNIDVMILAALRAQKKIGKSRAKFIIYPSEDMGGIIELTAKAKAYGLNPVFEPKPPTLKSDPDFQQFMAQTQKLDFIEKVEREKTKIEELGSQYPRKSTDLRQQPQESTSATPPFHDNAEATTTSDPSIDTDSSYEADSEASQPPTPNTRDTTTQPKLTVTKPHKK